ncbi:MAG TPA: hypothetical protein VJN43_23345 [Bryobacteraceae bacterium]|nr:hypothetical protein [Bryobacteraceae bacterium]
MTKPLARRTCPETALLIPQRPFRVNQSRKTSRFGHPSPVRAAVK